MEEFSRNGDLMRILLRYIQTQLMKIAQLAVCNSHHSTEQRLSRHLLEMLDRGADSELACTQESLGAILGVRREGITDAVTNLQLLGMIRWRRGHVTMLSRPALETHACECYQVVRKAVQRLTPALPDVTRHCHSERRQAVPAETHRQAAPERRLAVAAPYTDSGQAQLVFG